MISLLKKIFNKNRENETRKETFGNTLKKNKKGYQSKLHKAVISGNLVKVRQLIDQKEDVNLVDNHGLTPLDLAYIHDYSQTINFLKENGAKKSRELKN